MTTKEQDEIIDKAMVRCEVCHDYVPFTHNYYNGRKVNDIGHVCAGCMMASSIFKGTPDREATQRVSAYMKMKHEETQAVSHAYKICGTDGKALPQNELDKLIMPPGEYAEKHKDNK